MFVDVDSWGRFVTEGEIEHQHTAGDGRKGKRCPRTSMAANTLGTVAVTPRSFFCSGLSRLSFT